MGVDPQRPVDADVDHREHAARFVVEAHFPHLADPQTVLTDRRAGQ